MKAKELINLLSKQNPEAEVLLLGFADGFETIDDFALIDYNKEYVNETYNSIAPICLSSWSMISYRNQKDEYTLGEMKIHYYMQETARLTHLIDKVRADENNVIIQTTTGYKVNVPKSYFIDLFQKRTPDFSSPQITYKGQEITLGENCSILNCCMLRRFATELYFSPDMENYNGAR